MPSIVEKALRHPWITLGAVLGAAAVAGAGLGAGAEVALQHRKARRARA